MEIRITYVCDGAMYCGFKPEGVEVLEERQILYPAEDYELENIDTKERFSAVWLKDGDTEDNYTEIVISEEKSD